MGRNRVRPISAEASLRPGFHGAFLRAIPGTNAKPWSALSSRGGEHSVRLAAGTLRDKVIRAVALFIGLLSDPPSRAQPFCPCPAAPPACGSLTRRPRPAPYRPSASALPSSRGGRFSSSWLARAVIFTRTVFSADSRGISTATARQPSPDHPSGRPGPTAPESPLHPRSCPRRAD